VLGARVAQLERQLKMQSGALPACEDPSLGGEEPRSPGGPPAPLA